jgi:hypothetical protein
MKYFYETKTEGYSYNIGAKFDDKGRLIISDWACGDIIEKTHSDSDIEHFITITPKNIHNFIQACCIRFDEKVPKKNNNELALATLFKIFDGHDKAIFEIKNVLKGNNIPYDFQVC